MNHTIDFRILDKFGDNVVHDYYPELVYYCPKCLERRGKADTKGKLYVNNESLNFQCWACGYKGNLKYRKTKGYHLNEKPHEEGEMQKMLKSFMKGDENKKERIYQDDVVYMDYAIPNIRPYPGTPYYEYLKNRGIYDWMISYYDIRVGSFGSKYQGRVIIPNQVICENNVCYTDMFVARYIWNDIKDPVTGEDRIPKYLNPPGRNKANVVFNLHRISPNSPIIVVEGVMTAMAAGKNAVCTYGKEVSDVQICQILNKNPSCLYMNLDPDAYDVMLELCKRIRKMSRVPIKIVRFMKSDGEHADASDIGHSRYMKYLVNAIPYDPVKLDFMTGLGIDHRYLDAFIENRKNLSKTI